MNRRDWMQLLTLALLGAGTRTTEASTIREVPERELFSVGDTRRYGPGFKITFAAKTTPAKDYRLDLKISIAR
jgi:hypothetical protein